MFCGIKQVSLSAKNDIKHKYQVTSIKYKRTQVKEIRYQQYLHLPFLEYESLHPHLHYSRWGRKWEICCWGILILIPFQCIESGAASVGQNQPCIWLFSSKAREYFLGYYIFCAQKFSFFQGPSSISCFKSCCDCCRTRDVIFRCFL